MITQRVRDLGLVALSTVFALLMGYVTISHHYPAVLLLVFATLVALGTGLRIARLKPDRAGAVRFQTLAEAIPQIVWIAEANGQTTYITKRWYEMTGTAVGAGLGSECESVHPDDRAPCHERWRNASARERRSRSNTAFTMQSVATVGILIVPSLCGMKMESSGTGSGTCTDIEEQKHYQQVLEDQIKQGTEELAETNTRLQQEMLEKDLARRTLDTQNEQMMQALKERSQRATLLAKMGELLQSCQTREEVFTAALGFAPKIFPARRGAVALFNPSHDLVEVAGHWHDCQIPASLFEPESCWALCTGHPHLVLAGDNTARCGHAAGLQSTYLCGARRGSGDSPHSGDRAGSSYQYAVCGLRISSVATVGKNLSWSCLLPICVQPRPGRNAFALNSASSW